METKQAVRHYSGSCLCGGIQYELLSELGPIDVCYCRMCRKASGGPLATNAPVVAEAFRLVDGAGLLRAYESSPGEKRHFCGRCGSPIFSQREDRPNVLRIRVGAINEPLNVRPVLSYHTASKCNWWEVPDGLPRSERE